MKARILTALTLSLVMAMNLAACGSSSDSTSSTSSGEAEETEEDGEETEESGEETEESGEDAQEETDEEFDGTVSGSQQAVTGGFDWGPAVTKTIISLDQTIASDSVDAEDFEVTEVKESYNWAALADETIDATEHIISEAERTVTAAYASDAEGNAIDGDSDYITLELYYSPDDGSPFCYDLNTEKNTICDPYELTITLAAGSALTTSDGSSVTELNVESDVDIEKALEAGIEDVDLSGSFTGSDGKTLTYGSYEPEEDGEQHPLVIWLHGAGEGGTDPLIPIYGAEVTALYGEEFQEIMGGAYVLSPQTPEFWLCYDEEDLSLWGDNPGTDSIYLATLMELIEDYVEEHPDVDPDRIYLTGCSNGGYMVMDLILNYPDYFAAAVPICEAYLDEGITDEQLEGIADLPIWFVYAQNDTVVDPTTHEVPTIERLEAIGADVHSSVFDQVVDTSGLYTQEDGSAYEYIGHYSWVYFFNNECEEDGVSLWQWMSQQSLDTEFSAEET